jgi:Domain of unknown function (DUF4145)
VKCPHCSIEFHDAWSAGNGYADDDGLFSLRKTTCPKCLRLILLADRFSISGGSTGTMMLYPRAPMRPLAPEVLEPYAGLFNEAALTLPDSPRASAALSRRCLQQLLRQEAKVPPGKLYDEIEHVLANRLLPSHLNDGLHGLRELGNMAAHPMKNSATGEVVEVEPGEAEWTLDILEGLFDFYFVEPAKTAARKTALDAKLGRSTP